MPSNSSKNMRAEPGQLWEFPLDGGGLLGWLVAGSKVVSRVETGVETRWLMVPVDSEPELGPGDRAAPLVSESDVAERVALRLTGARWVRETDLWFAVPRIVLARAFVSRLTEDLGDHSMEAELPQAQGSVGAFELDEAGVDQSHASRGFGANEGQTAKRVASPANAATADPGVWQQAARDLDRWLARRVVDAELREITDATALEGFRARDVEHASDVESDRAADSALERDGSENAAGDADTTSPFERPLAAASHDWLGDLVAEEPAQPARRFAIGGGLEALELECDPQGFCLRGADRPRRLVCLGANGGRRFVSWMPQLTGGWRSAWIERTDDAVRLLIEQRADLWDVRFELPS